MTTSSVKQFENFLKYIEKLVEPIKRPRFKQYGVAGLKELVKKYRGNVKLIGVGGENFVVKLFESSNPSVGRVFRIYYHQPNQDRVNDFQEMFDVLHKEDFGILAPKDLKYSVGRWLYWEVEEARSFQGCSYEDLVSLLKKVLKLSAHGWYWNDFYDGNIITHPGTGKPVIVDFTLEKTEWWASEIERMKPVTKEQIDSWRDVVIRRWDWKEVLRFRKEITKYLGFKITNESWMRLMFGMYLWKLKNNILMVDGLIPSKLIDVLLTHGPGIWDEVTHNKLTARPHLDD